MPVTELQQQQQQQLGGTVQHMHVQSRLKAHYAGFVKPTRRSGHVSFHVVKHLLGLGEAPTQSVSILMKSFFQLH